MVYLAGIIEADISIEGNSACISPGGYVYGLARRLRNEVDPRVGLLCPLSNDGPGRVILESLVHEKLFFDPSLVSSSLTSFIRISDKGGRTTVYSTGSAPVSAQSQELLDSLRGNSDVDVIVLTSSALYYQPLYSSLLDAATFLEPRPTLVVDVASSSFEHPDEKRYVKQLREAAGYAQLLILEEEDVPLFAQSDAFSLAPVTALVRKDGSSILSQDGQKSEIRGGKLEIYRRLFN